VSTGALGDWYANVLSWRRPVALFVNARSLLPVVVPLAPARSVVERLPVAFGDVARSVGVDGPTLDREIVEMDSYVLAKTESRTVLGVMNDFARLADDYRRQEDTVELPQLACWLAQTPCGPLRTSTGFPDRELAALLGASR